jgi:4-amino-4-deoxy-L-arabinose transferase-like glycosyltransferase
VFQSRKIDFLVLAFVCFAAFWWQLGALGLIDPDEPFYAQTAHEMVKSGDWLTPQIYGAPQFEKPIFYYWLLGSSFRALGETEFSGRLPTAVFATLLTLLTWVFGCRVWNRRAGFCAALVLATGLEFCVMSRLMLTDVPLAVFFTGAVYAYWKATREEARRNLWIFLHFVCTALAVLTKGPIGSLVPLMATLCYSFSTRRPLLLFRGAGFWWGLAAYAVIVLPWYGLMFAEHGRQFWDEFFVRDNFLRMIRAEHPANNHFWYYPGLLFLGSIPWMPAVALMVRRSWGRWRADDGAWLQWCWLLTSLVFLTLAQSKLPSYAFYLFVPLALLVGRTLDDLFERGFLGGGERWMTIGLCVAQCAGALAAPLLKIARPFGVPVVFLSALLAISLVFLFRNRFRPWLLLSGAASMALLAGALTLARPAVEAESSARPVAQALKRLRQDDEPLVSGKFLVRGIIYYTRSPVSIIAKNAQPFWAAHPLPVILWKDGLKEFMASHPTALFALRKSEWESLKDEEAFKGREAFDVIGENIVVRARAPKAAGAPANP